VSHDFFFSPNAVTRLFELTDGPRARARVGSLRLLRFARNGTESKMTEGQLDELDTPPSPAFPPAPPCAKIAAGQR
jgi:hypothetical protein